MKVGFKPQVLNFVERNRNIFFEQFKALDKFKNHIRVHFTEYDDFTTIRAIDKNNKELGFYDILFKRDERSIIGSQLLVHDEGRNIGQLLTLSSLMTLSKNNLNHFKIFSLKDVVPFHTRLGFVIQSDDPYYISSGLKQIIKSKLPHIEELQYKAKFFHPQVKNADPYSKQDEPIFKRGCKVLSDYMAYLTRNKLNKELPSLENGCFMDYTDWDLHINHKYLNSLAKHHNIDFEF